MPKERKVKRYRKIYKRATPVSLALKWIGAAVLICVLGFVGWSAYAPVMEHLSQLTFQQTQDSSFLEVSSSPVSESAVSSNSSEPIKPPEQPEALQPQSRPIHAVYLPHAVLLDSQRLDAALDQFSSAGINAIMFDLKDEYGAVLYQSKLEQVKLARAQDTYAQFDLELLCQKLTEKGFTPIGRLNAMRDHVAALRIPNAGILYLNSKIAWLDNAPEQGGRAWLNPYSPEARSYLTDLAVEAASMGVSQIMLANFSFPIGYGLQFANYGPNAAATSKQQVLSEFLTQLEQKTTDAGAVLNLYLSGPAALGAYNQSYGDQNPLSFTDTPVTINLSPVQFGNGFTLDDFSIANPAANPQATASALLKQISPATEQHPMSGLILAGANIYADPAKAIQGQLDALRESGIENYILYSQNGNYPTLSGG